ncbi:uncharacterized protein DUF3995 [Haloactinopolyspora alba]|uniref:Uncharacterized protein DUF3995 n=1 Tax=Haloactinopolyspora alba TaxID=648780 RepID=A0A2P8EC47_9ACTN|nr:DUF3995 domain-containing protein [Haloactinopolyspora alba]PSL07034.1 uncharacterized protein DUF3995 [Haloactinopolyspora alba]
MSDITKQNPNTSGPRRSALELVGPAGLAGLGAVHAAWALGWRWPGGTDEAWAERLAGSPEMPSTAATWAMALGLTGAAGAVSAAHSRRLRPGRLHTAARLASWGMAAGLLGRSVYFLPSDLTGDTTIFDRLDLTVYAPLSAFLGVSIAAGLRHTARADADPTAA